MAVWQRKRAVAAFLLILVAEELGDKPLPEITDIVHQEYITFA
jgi:hypothetical protein